jgi:hypothetical protein
MVRISLTISIVVSSLTIALAGCGGGDGDSGSSSTVSSTHFDASSSLANFASPGSVVFAEGELRPEGEMKSNVDSVTSTLTGKGNLGEFVASELEEAALEKGDALNFRREVEPWLGKAAAVAFKEVEAGGGLSSPLTMIETDDEEATLKFLQAHLKGSGKHYKYTSYDYVGINTGGPERNSIGVFDGALVIADNKAEFKAAITASEGKSLADEKPFADAFSAASGASFANVYVDVGKAIERSGDKVDQARELLESSGIDPSEATAVASVIPGADQIEIDLSSDLGGEKAPSDDASQLLGTMPATSIGAFAVSGFGEQLEEAIDNLDESGTESGLPPNKLKSTLSEAGIDLDKIAASLEDAAVYIEGNDRESLGGAMVVTADGEEAEEAIAALGTLLRGAKVPGVTAVSGKASGFSIRGEELGRKPLVVIAEGGRIAIGYGLPEALRGLEADSSGPTLSGDAAYKDAVSALGSTPISAFVNGSGALGLAEALVPHSKADFWEAVPYLKKVDYLALGAGESEEPATAKLIVGLEK